MSDMNRRIIRTRLFGGRSGWLLAVMMLAVMASGGNILFAADTLRVGIYDFKPLVYQTERGTPAGIYVDIIKEIAKRENWALEFVHSNWPTCLEMLEKGDIDLLTGILSSPAREKKFAFNTVSVVPTWGQLYTARDVDVESFLDLEGTRIAVVRDGYFYPKLKQKLRDFKVNARFIEVDKYVQVFQYLEQGKADACSAERVTGLQAETDFDIQQTPLMYDPEEFRFAAPAGHREILQVIDRHLKQLKASENSVYQQTVERHLYPMSLTDFVPKWLQWVVILLVIGFGITLGTVYYLRKRIRQRTADLRHSEDKYRRMFELAPEAVVLLDTKGTVMEVNGRLEDWLDYRPEEITGKNLWQLPFLPQQSRDELQVKFAQRMAGEKVPPYELAFVSRNGEQRTGLVHAAPLTDINGRINADLVLISDITERKKTEEELRKTRQQMIDQERQRALTTMASGIAHDFNNALSPIQGFSRMLLDDPDLLDDRQTALNYLLHIQKAADNAATTIRRMRKFYRPSEEDIFTELDLNGLITDTVSMTRPRWKEEAAAQGKHIDIQTRLEDIPAVSGNEAELTEVVTNLIFNAVDAMPNGGVITLSTAESDSRILLKVSDTGSGMSEATKSRCLDPFFTTKGVNGSGLGLATVAGVLQRHSGSISIESREGEGTTFCITLPVAEMADEITTERNGKTVPVLKILAVEDEVSQRELLHDVLVSYGHEVETAADGIEARNKFQPSWFDVVITDRAMSRMGGDQLAKEIKQLAPDKPVLMLTGFGDMMDAAGEKPPAVDVVIAKPLTKEKLAEAFKKVL